MPRAQAPSIRARFRWQGESAILHAPRRHAPPTRETMRTSTLLRLAAGVILAQCSALAFALDPLSYARYDQVKTSALNIDLKADFTHKTLSGFAELSLDWIDKNAATLDLDTRGLTISKVEAHNAQGKWVPAAYTL